MVERVFFGEELGGEFEADAAVCFEEVINKMFRVVVGEDLPPVIRTIVFAAVVAAIIYSSVGRYLVLGSKAVYVKLESTIGFSRHPSSFALFFFFIPLLIYTTNDVCQQRRIFRRLRRKKGGD